MLKNFYCLFKMQGNKIMRHYICYIIVSLFHGAIFDFLPLLYITLLNAVERKIFPRQNLLLYVTVTMVTYLAIKLWSLSNEKTKNKILKTMTYDLCHKFLNMKKYELSKNTSTYWRTLLSEDVYYVAELFTDFLFTVPANIISVLITLGIICYYDLKTFVISLIYIFFNYCLLYLRQIKIMPKIDAHQIFQKDLKTQTESFFAGYNDIRGGGYKNFILNLFLQKSRNNYLFNRTIIFADFFIQSFINIIHFVYIISVLFLFKQNIYLTLGVIVLIITSVQKLWNSLTDVINDMNYLQEYAPYVKRILSVYNIPDEIEKKPLLISEFINYKNVNIGYGKPILQNLSFSFCSGEHLIINGKSGIGKSTLIKSFQNDTLILKGEAFFSKEFIDNSIYLYQTPYIFNRSIRDNFLIDENLKLDDKKIISWITKLELNSLKNEDGIIDLNRNMKTLTENISGGEKSRIAIMRVLLKNPNILILDEPLIGVSGKMREDIIAVLKNELKNKSIILITHSDDLKSICTNAVNLNLEAFI